MSQMVSAQSMVSYEQWKAKQEQHDLRLQQKILKTNTLPLRSTAVTAQADMPSQPIEPSTQVLGTALKVNINQATAQELSAKLDSIGQKKAQAIVQYREQHGAFKRIDELKNVKGIGDKIYARNQNRLKLQD